MSDFTQSISVVVRNNAVVPISVVGEKVGIELKNTTVISGQGDRYTGSYSFVPSDEVQTIETRNALLEENITIAAIPQNYGRIDWNGSFLTVS